MEKTQQKLKACKKNDVIQSKIALEQKLNVSVSIIKPAEADGDLGYPTVSCVGNRGPRPSGMNLGSELF